MDLINRVGVVIPADSPDPAGDARRLESLGFGHGAFRHAAPTHVLLALGATRKLRVEAAAGTVDRLQATEELPAGSRERLEAFPCDQQPLLVDPADAATTRSAIARRLTSDPHVTVELLGAHAAACRTLALDVLSLELPGRSTTLLHAEDLSAGQRFDLGEYHLTDDDIVSFAERFDPLDFHLDPQLAAASPLGLLCASGIHTQAIMQRLNARGFNRSVAVVAGRGILDMRLPMPVTPGLVLRGTTTVMDVQLRASGRAVVTVRLTLHAADRLVLEQTGEMVVQQRQATPEPAPAARPA